MRVVPPPVDAVPARKRVLIIEDLRDSAEMMAMLVSTLGHHAKYVTDPLQAIAVAREFQPDVIFVDISMPGLNGWQVARLLRQEPGFGDTQIYALTARYGDEASAVSSASGFDQHFIKPIAVDRLEALLR